MDAPTSRLFADIASAMKCEIEIRGKKLELLPDRALYWPAKKALLLSDLHWGKSAHFRKAGIAMPLATQQQDGLRLAKVVRETGAERLIIAGDLFHSRHNHEVEDFGHWRSAHATLHIDFIAGNHDILGEDVYQRIGLTLHREALEEGPFYISHDDVVVPGLYTIHGHLHPGLTLPGPGRSTLPCFCVGERVMVLPAFGQFTGFYRVRAGDYRNVYVVGEGKVLRAK
jgi:uncharacterized protein